MIVNSLKILFGKTGIGLIYYPWRIMEKILGRKFGSTTKAHYYIMMFFRSLFKSFFTVIKYPNELSSKSDYIKLKVDLCQNNQQWFFRLKGNYELKWLKMIACGMPNAETFVDIGSNIGVYAITIAQTFPEKRVVAIEPLIENYASLNNNIALNSLSNIKVYNAAVSNLEGNEIKFYPNPIHDGGGTIIKSSFYRTGDIKINAEEFQKKNPFFIKETNINNIKIDDIISSKSVIKIDVEGAEILVLESGSKVFKKDLVDMMVIEVLDETIDNVISICNDYMFDCYAKGMIAPLKSGKRLKHFVGNILCLRRGSSQYIFLKEKFFHYNEQYNI